MSELKSCPFCGGHPNSCETAPELIADGFPMLYAYICYNDECPSRTWHETKQIAINEWNTRAPPDDRLREAEEIIDILASAILDAKVVFLSYADLHDAKDTLDGRIKASNNRQHAARQSQALAALRDWEGK